MRRTVLFMVVLLAPFVVLQGRSAAQAPSSFVRVYSPPMPGLTIPGPKDRSIAQFTRVAMPAQFRGDVRIDITVGTDGRVSDALVKESPSGFDDSVTALLASMSEWTYEPGRLHGVAVPVRMEARLSFDYSRR
jgi:outer membrane biosynthesis protein TonB